MVKLPNDERVVVVALGESGSGKSNLLNLLLSTPGEQRIVFPEGEGAEPCTLEPQEESGCWRGDPARQITVFDTPGLCAEDGLQSDLDSLRRVLHLVKDLSYINCFLLVVRGGTSRFLSQHQKMFQALQDTFGEELWKNVVFDVSGDCNGRDRKNFEKWIDKLQDRFDYAKSSGLRQVFINTMNHQLDTLEDLWEIITGMDRYTFSNVKSSPKLEVDQQERSCTSPDMSSSSNTSYESRLSANLSQSLSDLRSQRSEVRSRPSSRTDFSPSRYQPSSSRLDLTSSRYDLTPSRLDLTSSRHGVLELPYMPPLPPRSPTQSRRRSYQPPRSVTSTPRLPRSYMPTTNLTEDFSISKYSTPRFGRRSFRETSPVSYSTRSSVSRDSSPVGSMYKTVGIPTYLRTCTAYKKPFTKAMREGRLALSHASEDRILLEKSEDIPYPDLENLDAVISVPFGENLVRASCESTEFPRPPGTLLDMQPMQTFTANLSVDTFTFLVVSLEGMEQREEEETEDWAPTNQQETFKARRSSVKEDNSHLVRPDTLVLKNPLNFVKRALLPKVKYHWDQGFRQGSSGWEKVPVIKFKVKYNEEDKELLPTYISIEGGRWCESKRIRMEGHKAKCKLRATEGPEFDIRVVPLDKDLKLESSIPEFLLTIVPGPKEKEGEKEKWIKGEVHPSLPE